VRQVPPEPPKPIWAVEFDGIDDYLWLPLTYGLRSVSFWVTVDSSQPSQTTSLFDARYWQTQRDTMLLLGRSFPELYLNNKNIGQDIARLVIDGEDAVISFASLRRDVWMHVYIEAAYEFDDDVNLMSNTISGEEYTVNGDFTKGRIAAVALWGRALPLGEVRPLPPLKRIVYQRAPVPVGRSVGSHAALPRTAHPRPTHSPWLKPATVPAATSLRLLVWCLSSWRCSSRWAS
jgi:hypothetical protein